MANNRRSVAMTNDPVRAEITFADGTTSVGGMQ
jgi:hypothetical protein